MRWRRLKSFCFNIKIIFLTVLVVAFSGGLVPARYLLPGASSLPQTPVLTTAPAPPSASPVTAASRLDSQRDLVPGLLLGAVNAGGARLDSVFFGGLGLP